MAKLIQLSDDSGTTWYTIPGSTGSLDRDTNLVADTVFGQTFSSQEVGIIGWSLNANAFYKGFTGYVAEIKQQGSTTAMTTEATTIVSGKTYKIDDTTKEIFDRGVTMTIFDNAVDKTAEILSINYLFGEVTFKASYTITGDVTITGSYFPTTVLGTANNYSLTQTAEAIDVTDFATAQANGGFRAHDPGLRTVSLELTGFYAIANAFAASLEGRSELIIEINPDGNAKSIARGFFKASSHGQDGDVGALEEETVSFTLNVPDPSGTNPPEIPFGWQHANDTTLSTALQIALAAWEGETKLDYRYLPDGTAGDSGTGVLIDISLSGGLETMNEFAISVQGDGALAVVS